MYQPIAAVIVVACSSFALAQGTAPANPDKMKQQEVQSTSQGAVDMTGSRATAAQDAKNTAASKKMAKPATAQRGADLKAMEGQVDSSGGRATAAQDAKNTAASKKVTKATAAQKQADGKATSTEVDTSGSRATAAQDANNTAKSKEMLKQ